jgi:hypothetical protein
MRRPVLALAALTAVACAAGCTGSSSPAASPARSSSGAPSVTTPSVPSTAPASTSSAGTTPAPRPTRAAPGVPACAPTSITVAKAPFCFTLPAGFTDFSSLRNYGKGWTYRTLVSIGQHDLIEVLAAANPDTDATSEAALKAMYGKVFLLHAGELNITQAGPAQRVAVDGARAYRQVARYSNGVSTDVTTVYRGRTVLNIQCQTLDRKATVEAACASVQASLDFVHR